jgi:hypothetical protein
MSISEPVLAPAALLAGHTAMWRRVGFPPRIYLLAVEGQLVARLTVNRTLRLSSTITAAGQSWEISARGFWSSTIVIRRSGEESPVAEFHPRLWAGFVPRGGTLEFENGRRFVARVSFWRAEYALLDDQERPLVTARSRGVLGPGWSGVDVEVAHEAANLPELPILAGFVFHQMLASARRSH